MKKETTYLCSKCGSTNWKFPNPLKISESMINFPGMVKNLLECKNCGCVGVFLVVDKNKVKEVQRKLKKNGK